MSGHIDHICAEMKKKQRAPGEGPQGTKKGRLVTEDGGFFSLIQVKLDYWLPLFLKNYRYTFKMLNIQVYDLKSGLKLF